MRINNNAILALYSLLTHSHIYFIEKKQTKKSDLIFKTIHHQATINTQECMEYLVKGQE